MLVDPSRLLRPRLIHLEIHGDSMTSIHRYEARSIVLAVACGSLWLPLRSLRCGTTIATAVHLARQICRINVDGSGQQYFNFSVPNQATWQPGPIFPDGKRLIFLSMEPRRDVAGKPFEEYYTQTPTHLWIHDLATGDLQEICTKDRLAVFVTPALLLGDDRMLIQVVRDKVGQIFSVRLDGSDAREFTRAGEGMPYGLSLSPDKQRVAFHLASPTGYQVWTSDLNGEQRQHIAADPNHLYFGTSWSPDGESVLYVDCHYHEDPGHDWADVCVGKADGSQHRVLTTGQAMWFAATYGNRDTRGGGSNLPAWTHDGKILFPRRHPDSKVAWEYQPQRPDVDHFNRDYKPEQARGEPKSVGSTRAMDRASRLPATNRASGTFGPLNRLTAGGLPFAAPQSARRRRCGSWNPTAAIRAN